MNNCLTGKKKQADNFFTSLDQYQSVFFLHLNAAPSSVRLKIYLFFNPTARMYHSMLRRMGGQFTPDRE